MRKNRTPQLRDMRGADAPAGGEIGLCSQSDLVVISEEHLLELFLSTNGRQENGLGLA